MGTRLMRTVVSNHNCGGTLISTEAFLIKKVANNVIDYVLSSETLFKTGQQFNQH